MGNLLLKPGPERFVPAVLNAAFAALHFYVAFFGRDAQCQPLQWEFAWSPYFVAATGGVLVVAALLSFRRSRMYVIWQITGVIMAVISLTVLKVVPPRY
jgi:hypothetical protein